ncbi:RagB/SusD family nutrient uptake outer membrane protein [Prolixibacter denitrificans]|uniref:Glycan metabolism protein RagB n=1 Tax=Prolixibacter denitrificans TaxID=1541063 RepID=A0A2P8C8M8_9BACT|nr:RagB/SusD family nutrient uptake outer membrane protein [Prolixibacter denitrificans]PSK81316.1 putative outer membrane starch-binding protein [Prolixibacter denitrificans]GET21599.1 glycan metabolism protein RagB [Prolixibacter denitrificans]
MKKIIFLTLLAVVGTFYSCSDSWFELKPKGSASISQFYNEKGINALLIGAYAALDGEGTDAGWAGTYAWAGSVSNWVWGSVASDDAYKGSEAGDQSTINPIERFEVTSTNGYVSDKWHALYDGIARCNEVLAAIAETPDDVVSADKKAWFAGQARFLRAHFYFDMTRTYKQVPYIDENTEAPESVPNDHMLWPEIEADFQFAVQNLNESEANVGFATKWAAETALARVYMFEEKYSEAKPLLDDVINNGPFVLMDDFQQNYLIAYNNNAESIFEVQYSVNDGAPESFNGGYGDALNFPYAPAIGVCCGFHQPSQNLVNAYKVDANGLPLFNTFNDSDIPSLDASGENVITDTYTDPVDPRLDFTVGRPGIPYLDWGIQGNKTWVRDLGNGGPYLYKKNMFLKSERGTLSTTSGWATGVNANNYRMYRLAHVILWRAEVAAQENDLGTAMDLVNQIRNRAKNSSVVTFDDGTPAANYDVEPYTSFPDQAYALRAVQWEMRLEFAMEGMRFFDLVRWGIAADVMNAYLTEEATKRTHLTGASFTAGKNEYFPIPQQQIDLSVVDGQSVLQQNPGY